MAHIRQAALIIISKIAAYKANVNFWRPKMRAGTTHRRRTRKDKLKILILRIKSKLNWFIYRIQLPFTHECRIKNLGLDRKHTYCLGKVSKTKKEYPHFCDNCNKAAVEADEWCDRIASGAR